MKEGGFVKRYIKSAENPIHITELFDSIDCIVIVPDAATRDSDKIFGTYAPDYSMYTDEYVKNMSPADLYNTNDDDLLAWLRENKDSILTKDQKDTIIDILSTKQIIDSSDVLNTIKMLKQCNDIRLIPTDKNRKFDKNFNVSTNEKLKILHRLTLGDYITNSIDTSFGYTGDPLIVFMPKIAAKTKKGILRKNVLVYVKLDLSEVMDDGSIVAVVSFHEAENGDMWHPYKTQR